MTTSTTTNYASLAEFLRNAPDEERRRVFQKVAEEAIEDQRAIIRQAQKMRAKQGTGEE